MRKLLTRTILFASVMVVYVAVANQLVVAQVDQSLTIIPPRFELFGNPGDTMSETIRIRNDSEFPATYSVLVQDFTTSGEEGRVVLEEGDSTITYSLANWIEPETKDLILQPSEERSFNFVVNIPRDAEPGGHYASVLFQTTTTQIPGAASVAQRIGSLVLLRVTGNVTEDALIEEFSTLSYQESGPIDFTLRVKNNGNTHIRPEGTIVITNMFDKKVAEVPLNSRNVLPGAIRLMTTQWDDERLLGRYKASLVATYGRESQTLTDAIYFTVASRTAIIVISVAVISIVGVLISLVAGRKRFGKALRTIFTGN
jgi:hypothetical protein